MASRLLRGGLIIAASAFALIGCFGAKFITYDDSAHIASQEYANESSAWAFFVPKTNTTYMPLTYISYKGDKWLHEWWTTKWFADWAPGVRLDTLLIHAAGALFLWRLLVRLRFSERRAFFIGLIFACHPTACETVCWASERKTALAGMFGFATVWALCNPKRPAWRWPLTCMLFGLALLGKPSALGLLPILVLIELILTVPALRMRFFGANEVGTPEPPPAPRAWLPSVAGFAALAVIALADLRANLFTHGEEIVLPPGGSVFTALLTDLEIFSRYLFNLVFPFKLSAVYAVDSIRSLSDPRVWIYGPTLAAVCAVTIVFARNRWRCAFGWFWFFAAMGPNANVIAISHAMEDRYAYLAAPGFFIALTEMAAGLCERFVPAERGPRILGMAGAIFALVCVALSTARGFVWRSTPDVFLDAVQKQPTAFYARYGLGFALYQEYRNARPGSKEEKLFYNGWMLHLTAALEECPDNVRYGFRSDVAALLGEEAFKLGDARRAEHWFAIGAEKNAEASERPWPRALSLAHLSVLEKGSAEKALETARESLRVEVTDKGRFALARAAIASAHGKPAMKEPLLKEARQALQELASNEAMKADVNVLWDEIRKFE